MSRLRVGTTPTTRLEDRHLIVDGDEVGLIDFRGAAFAAVLMYRLSTCYLPPIWGFVALR